MKRLIIITVVFLLINSCGDESAIFDPTYFGDGFKGITFTNEDGPEPIKEDLTDWYYTISNQTSNGDNASGIDVDVKGIKGFMFGSAFPNPSKLDRSFKLRFAIPNDMFVTIYIINKNYEIVTVLVNRELAAGTHGYWFENKILKIPGVYRVVMETEGFYSKGDVWIK